MGVIVMAVVVHMLMSMLTRLMAVLMAIVGMRHCLVLMLVLMFVFVMAAHVSSPPFTICFIIMPSGLIVKEEGNYASRFSTSP